MSATVKRKPRRKPAPVEDRRSGSPAEQLAADLHRFRAAELPFERAWALAYDRVRWPHNTHERHTWKAILSVSRPRFRAAFAGDLDARPVQATGKLRAA